MKFSMRVLLSVVALTLPIVLSSPANARIVRCISRFECIMYFFREETRRIGSDAESLSALFAEIPIAAGISNFVALQGRRASEQHRCLFLKTHAYGPIAFMHQVGVGDCNGKFVQWGDAGIRAIPRRPIRRPHIQPTDQRF